MQHYEIPRSGNTVVSVGSREAGLADAPAFQCVGCVEGATRGVKQTMSCLAPDSSRGHCAHVGEHLQRRTNVYVYAEHNDGTNIPQSLSSPGWEERLCCLAGVGTLRREQEASQVMQRRGNERSMRRLRMTDKAQHMYGHTMRFCHSAAAQ